MHFALYINSIPNLSTDYIADLILADLIGRRGICEKMDSKHEKNFRFSSICLFQVQKYL